VKPAERDSFGNRCHAAGSNRRLRQRSVPRASRGVGMPSSEPSKLRADQRWLAVYECLTRTWSSMMSGRVTLQTADRRSRWLESLAGIVLCVLAMHTVAQRPRRTVALRPYCPPWTRQTRGPNRALSGRLGRDHPAGVDQSAAARAGGSLSRLAQGAEPFLTAATAIAPDPPFRDRNLHGTA
jgi:hypothetical protein